MVGELRQESPIKLEGPALAFSHSVTPGSLLGFPSKGQRLRVYEEGYVPHVLLPERCVSVSRQLSGHVQGEPEHLFRRTGLSVCRSLEFSMNRCWPSTSASVVVCLARNCKINKLPLVIMYVCSPESSGNKSLER